MEYDIESIKGLVGKIVYVIKDSSICSTMVSNVKIIVEVDSINGETQNIEIHTSFGVHKEDEIYKDKESLLEYVESICSIYEGEDG